MKFVSSAWFPLRSKVKQGASPVQLMSVDVFVLYSEKFMVRLNKNGGPKNPEKVDRLCALFTVTVLIKPGVSE